MIFVPPGFVLLFLIPIVGAFFVYNKTVDLSITLLFYFLTQVGIASLAYYLYD